MSLCECGCGATTKVATYTKKSKGIEKGKHLRFVRGHNRLTLPIPAAERVWRDVEIAGDDECWPWTGRMDAGRATISDQGKDVSVARIIVISRDGDIGDDDRVRRTCGNHLCCNPFHLSIEKEWALHGTRSRYNNGCKCNECMNADRRERQQRYALRVEINGHMVAAHIPESRHGKKGTYTYHGCRCDSCVASTRN